MSSVRKFVSRIALGLLLLSGAGAAFAGDARPSMPYTGTATMLDDGTIELDLKTTADGKPAAGTLVYKIGDNAYDNILAPAWRLAAGAGQAVRRVEGLTGNPGIVSKIAAAASRHRRRRLP